MPQTKEGAIKSREALREYIRIGKAAKKKQIEEEKEEKNKVVFDQDDINDLKSDESEEEVEEVVVKKVKKVRREEDDEKYNTLKKELTDLREELKIRKEVAPIIKVLTESELRDQATREALRAAFRK